MIDFKYIAEKHNYSLELAEFLEKVYNEFLLYYPAEFHSIIQEAFLSCPVISASNCYTALKDNGLYDENAIGEKIVSDGDLKRASGCYSSNPDIVYDKNSKTYHIKSIKRGVIFNNSGLNHDYIKAVLIHELAHLVKAFYAEYEIKGDILFERSGLIETQYRLSYDGSKVTKTLIQETGVGLEEGFTSLVEERITRKIVNPEYKVVGYGIVKKIASSLSKYEAIITRAEFYKDKKELIDEFQEDYYFELESVVDTLYSKTLTLFSNLLNPAGRDENIRGIDEYIKNVYNPLVEKINDRKKGRL